MLNLDDLSQVSLAELMAAQNWQAQYRLITQWGKLIHPKPELRLAKYQLKGCETPVWLAHTNEAGLHFFAFDSDSRIMNGLAALLLSQLQQKTNMQIHAVNFTQLLTDAGLEKHLTPSRNNGLQVIIARAKSLVDAV